jgi:hypothetical protein
MLWEKEAVLLHMWPADANGCRCGGVETGAGVLRRETQIGLGQALTVHAYNGLAIGIGRRDLRRSNAFAADGGDESKSWRDESEAWRDDNLAAFIANEQAGHTSHVAEKV